MIDYNATPEAEIENCEADGESENTGIGEGCVDGTHPSTYTPANSSKHVVEDKTKQPNE